MHLETLTNIIICMTNMSDYSPVILSNLYNLKIKAFHHKNKQSSNMCIAVIKEVHESSEQKIITDYLGNTYNTKLLRSFTLLVLLFSYQIIFLC